MDTRGVTLLLALCFLGSANIANAFEDNCASGTECRPLSDCKDLIDQISSLHSNDGDEHKKFLTGYIRHHTCGFEGKKPKVCCPRNPEKKVCEAGTFCESITDCNLYAEKLYLNSDAESVMNHLVNITCGYNYKTAKICCPMENLSNDCGSFDSKLLSASDGAAISSSDFPWHALLRFINTEHDYLGCAGALISDQYVLTSATCTSGNIVGVQFGRKINDISRCLAEEKYYENCTNENLIEVGIKSVIRHPNYKYDREKRQLWESDKTYDIALLQLERSIGDSFQPVCLPDPKLATIKKGKHVVSGWGFKPFRFSDSFKTSNVKRIFGATFNRWDVCSGLYGYNKLEKDVMCVTGPSEINVGCTNDHGGPLMTVNKLGRMSVVGIYAPDDIESRMCYWDPRESFYTDVSQYMDWITSIIEP